MKILDFTWSFSTIYDWLVIHHDAIESVSFIAVILSAILVYIQIKLFLKDYTNKNKRAEYEKSYAMARFYAENLLPRMAPIRILLNKINLKVIKDYQDSFEDNISKMYAFNIGEARTIFGDTQIKQYRKFFKTSLEPNEMIYFFANFEHKTAVEIKSEWNNILKGKSKTDRQSFYSDKRTMLMRHIADLLTTSSIFPWFFAVDWLYRTMYMLHYIKPTIHLYSKDTFI